MIRLFFILIICVPLFSEAQIGNICVDSNRINPYYQCNNPEFRPVCGCNNVTYRNSCEMTNVGGVNYPSSTENGVCRSEFFFFFTYPNPVRDHLNFNLQFAEKQKSTVVLRIYNIFGNLVYYKSTNDFADFPTFPMTINFRNLESGMYTLVVQAAGNFKFAKFLKHDY